MATVKTIDIDSLVKFPVKGGFAYAKVVSFKEDGKLAVLQTPTDSITETNVENLISCTKKEYSKVMKDLANNFLAQASEDEASASNSEAKMVDTEAKMKELEAKLAEAEMKMKDMEKAKCDAEAMYKESEAKLTEAMKNMEDMKAKSEKAESALASLQRDIQSKERFDKLSKVDAASAVASDSGEALKILGEMSEASFNTIYNVAKAQFDKFEQAKAALPKSTEQTQTTLPKGTDQTQTSMPKGTDQTKASLEDTANAVKDAKVEEEETFVSAGSASKTNDFAQFINDKLAKKNKKVQKKSE